MPKKSYRLLRSIVIGPLVFLVTLYILFEDFLHHIVKPFVERISVLYFLRQLEDFLRNRHPYTLFGIYLCKLTAFISIKFFALYLISKGNAYGGTILACEEVIGAIVTVWYAKVALPSLLTIKHFATVYNIFNAVKAKLKSKLRSTLAYRYAKAFVERVRLKYKLVKNCMNQRRNGLLKAIYRFIHTK